MQRTPRPAPGAGPAPVRAAARVVAAEGAALTLLSIGYLASIELGHPDSRGVATFGALLSLAAGLLLLALSRGLARSRRATLSPIVLAQLLALPVAVGLFQGHLPGYGAIVMLPALAVLGLLFGTRDGRAVSRAE